MVDNYMLGISAPKKFLQILRLLTLHGADPLTSYHDWFGPEHIPEGRNNRQCALDLLFTGAHLPFKQKIIEV